MEDPLADHPTLSVVPVDKLTHGQFVMELDRPWLGTPFLLQGFLIESDDQLHDLRDFCQTVIVDRSRSLSGGERRAASPAPARLESTPAERALHIGTPTDAKTAALLAACRAAGRSKGQQRAAAVPQVNPEEGSSAFDEELLYSAPLVDDVVATLRKLRENPLDNLEDFETVSDLIGEMACAVERNPDALMWLSQLKATDEYSYDHALDVSIYLMIFGRYTGLPTKEVEDLGMAGLMQDIGKVDIPTEILNKPAALSEEEYELVKAHVASSLQILTLKRCFSPRVLEIVANHHERQDGSGYPRSLAGGRIPLYSEASGMIDTYCALTRDRPYGTAVSSQGALESLVRLRGSKFREALVDQFIQCLGIYPVGSLVELNSGEVAVVVQQNRVRRLMPRLLVLLAPDKTPARHPRSLDLMLQPKTPVGETYRITAALPKNAFGINPKDLFI